MSADRDWMRGSSPLKGALLGLLLQAPGHGYDLGNRLERRLGPAWRIDVRTLYRQLEQLKKAGLAFSDGRPDPEGGRVVYTATPAAAGALSAWMADDTPLEPMRAALQAKIVVAGPEHVSMLLRALERYEERCFEMLRAYSGEPPPLGSLLGIGMFLARESALVHLEAELTWTDTARRALVAFAAGS